MSRYNNRRQYICFYGSDRLRGKSERLRAKRDLGKGLEPEPKYVTGRYWSD